MKKLHIAIFMAIVFVILCIPIFGLTVFAEGESTTEAETEPIPVPDPGPHAVGFFCSIGDKIQSLEVTDKEGNLITEVKHNGLLLLASVIAPKIDGYKFSGKWFMDAEYSIPMTSLTITKPTEFWAKYEPIKYQVFYTSSTPYISIKPTTHDYNDQIMPPTDISEKAPGYEFLGWSFKPQPKINEELKEADKINTLIAGKTSSPDADTSLGNTTIKLFAWWKVATSEVIFFNDKDIPINITQTNPKTPGVTFKNNGEISLIEGTIQIVDYGKMPIIPKEWIPKEGEVLQPPNTFVSVPGKTKLDGWYDGSSILIKTFQNVKNDILAYTKYKETICMVNFYTQGGTPIPKQMKDIPYGSPVVDGKNIIELPVPARFGYTFLGWFTTNKPDLEVDKKIDENYLVVVPRLDLFAIWKPAIYDVAFRDIDGNTITNHWDFDTNSGFNGKKLEIDIIEGKQQVLHGTPTIEPKMPKFPANPKPQEEASGLIRYKGSTFKGWRDVLNNDRIYKENDPAFKSVTSDMILEPIYNFVEYVVNFNSKGGTPAKTSAKAIYNTNLGDLMPKTPTYKGRTLVGWYSSKDNGVTLDETKKFDASTPVTENMTVYAKWENTVYKVIFYVDNKRINKNDIFVDHGNPIDYKLIPDDTIFTGSGRRFTGWFTESEKGKKFNTSQKIEESPNNTLELYAQFIVDKYSVVFNSMGGSKVTSLNGVPHGSNLASIDKIPKDPVYKGRTFIGWFTSEDNGVTLSKEPFTITTPITKNTILFAKWENTIYTVTFLVDYKPVSESLKINFGEVIPLEKIPKPADFQGPGRRFKGWYTEPDKGKKFETNKGITSVESGVILNLYAQFDYDKYEIKFNSMGGTKISPISNAEYGSTIVLPKEPTKKDFEHDYDFKGWYTSKDSGITLDKQFTGETIVKEPMTLYAKWEIRTRSASLEKQESTIPADKPGSTNFKLRTKNMIDGGKITGLSDVPGVTVKPTTIKDTIATITVSTTIETPAGNHLFELDVDGVKVTGYLFVGKYSNFEYFIYDKSVRIVKYTGKDDKVKIPLKIEDLLVSEIASTTFTNNKKITSVDIPENISNIESGAFSGCTSLNTITVNAKNSSYTAVDGVLFDKGVGKLLYYPGAKAISLYNIPDTVNTIASGAFTDIKNLKTVTVPESVTTIQDTAFANNASVTIKGYASSEAERYANSKGIKFKLIGSEEINYELNDDDTVSLDKYTGKGGKVTVPATIENKQVTVIKAAAFSGNSSISEIIIPNGVITIEAGAFAGCTGLISISIPATVTEIGENAFSSCTNLTTIKVDAKNPGFSSLNGALLDKPITTLIKHAALAPNFIYTVPPEVQKISKEAFKDSLNLTSVIVPKTVTEIAKDAFPNRDNFVVKGYINSYVHKFTKENNVKFEPIGNNNYDFTINENGNIIINKYNGNGGDVYIPESIFGKKVTQIGKGAFKSAIGIESITIPDTINYIALDAFSGITDITIKGSVNSTAQVAAEKDKLNFEEVKPLVAHKISSKVILNGKKLDFDAYKVEWNNYFKLRDLAHVLNGTDKNFEIVYEEASDSINIITSSKYTIVGGEMETGVLGVKTPIPTYSSMYVDNMESEFTAYEIDGNNYFKLRDVAKVLNIGIFWDELMDTIIIDTNSEYMG